MSGIVGGTGSKSGIIGDTEIDYEEGTWTVTGTNVGGSSVGVYVKIGSMVFIQAWIIASGGSTTSAFGGLPFTADSGVGNAQGGGNTAYQNRDTTGKRQMGLLVSGTSLTMFDGRDTVVVGNGEQIHLQLSYKAVT